MAVIINAQQAGCFWATGLSTDTKPTTTEDNCGFFETDTGKVWKTLGGGVWNAVHIPSEITKTYQNQNLKTNVKVWTGLATTSGGVATFFPTDTNAVGGNALFTNIYSAIAIAANNTGTPINVPKTSIKLISADKKTITVNVISGVTITILITPTEVFAPDGTTVYLTVIGD